MYSNANIGINGWSEPVIEVSRLRQEIPEFLQVHRCLWSCKNSGISLPKLLVPYNVFDWSGISFSVE